MEQQLTEGESKALTTKCTGCGADFAYDIETGMLKCAHCGSTKAIEKDETVVRRQITSDVIKQCSEWKEATVFNCNNCGAKEVFERKEISRKCCFCGSTNIVATSELAGVRPDSVIPFQITKDSAIHRFRKYIKSKLFAPKNFKKADLNERINALYSPCWSFSANTENAYNGTLGRTVYHHHRDSRGQTITTTSINWFRVWGQINQNYQDFFVQSGSQIPPITFNKLMPFNIKLVTVYRQEYLSGIIAEHYSKNLETCFNSFAQSVRLDIRRRVMNKYRADHVQFMDIQTNYKSRKFNYVLLPLYIANYTYKNKTYNFYVNGASGAIVGKYPKSKLKISLLVLGSITLVAGIGVGIFFAML